MDIAEFKAEVKGEIVGIKTDLIWVKRLLMIVVVAALVSVFTTLME